ncbi:sulfite exporter TauE/SafE family protein [Desulfotomaculum sp. 1211_IL3151]|uniref:sulfite exporter TauE/SafE family protein n=1 Tax=Desulfotomaculum sp. 1211_IL3151 TaxID=3084055 RepID=UPI002FDA4286
MESILFSGSLLFMVIGILGGVLFPLLGKASIYMIVPLLVFVTGLPPEMAIPIGLAHFAALIIPAVVGHWQTGNIDYRLLFLLVIGLFAGLIFFGGMGDLSPLVLLPYLVLLIAAVIYKIRPFALLPKPNNRQRKIVIKMIGRMPGKMYLSVSGINVSFLVPLFLGILLAFTGKIFGPIATIIVCPILIICLDIPVMVAVATSMLFNFIGMLSIAMWHDFLAIPLNLQILLWMFLGSAVTILALSTVVKKKLYPIPVAALLVAITSFTLWALMISNPIQSAFMHQIILPLKLLGWFGGVQG